MFRIRRIFGASLPFDRSEIEQVQAIIRERFPTASAAEIEEIPERLEKALGLGVPTLLFVADDLRGRVHGFALVFHDRLVNFLYLDYIATRRGRMGSGLGGALYERVREEGRRLGVLGLFFECLPDERVECSSDEEQRGNAARLRFYERYGARPLIGTRYEAPLHEGEKGMPHLVFDDLDQGRPLRRAPAKKVIRSILEHRYGDLCPPPYVDMVVASLRDDPVRIREPRYHKVSQPVRAPASARTPKITLVVNAVHDIHHVRDRGYVEAPARIRVILKDLLASGLFTERQPRHYPERHILAVHDRGYVEYFKRVCASVPNGESVYPYVFPLRNQARPPRQLAVRAGYYCIDTFTPLNKNALLAATRAVDCTLTAADALLRGERLAYALVRPPGHHAERSVFGGFCYFNNNAIAAHYLSEHGRVAILDLDYHHGNGQQAIFYERSDVLTVSIHGHPRFAYPYFSGWPEETGEGPGRHRNVNLPLPESIEPERYRDALEQALARIRRHDPLFLVVALGLDTARGDPTGTWGLRPRDFQHNGERVGALHLPVLVVQEGGYRTRTLGANARAFFTGLVAGMETPAPGVESAPGAKSARTKNHDRRKA